MALSSQCRYDRFVTFVVALTAFLSLAPFVQLRAFTYTSFTDSVANSGTGQVHQGITLDALETIQFDTGAGELGFTTRAMAEIVQANVDIDIDAWEARKYRAQGLPYDMEALADDLHFDGEAFLDAASRIDEDRNEILRIFAIGNPDVYPEARRLLGGLLHTLQDFYSHSTWIERGEVEIVNFYDLGTNDPRFARDGTLLDPICEEDNTVVIDGAPLSSGYYPNVPDAPGGQNKCLHGNAVKNPCPLPELGIDSPGINKDRPCRIYHALARNRATRESIVFTEKLIDALAMSGRGARAVCALLGHDERECESTEVIAPTPRTMEVILSRYAQDGQSVVDYPVLEPNDYPSGTRLSIVIPSIMFASRGAIRVTSIAIIVDGERYHEFDVTGDIEGYTFPLRASATGPTVILRTTVGDGQSCDGVFAGTRLIERGDGVPVVFEANVSSPAIQNYEYMSAANPGSNTSTTESVNYFSSFRFCVVDGLVVPVETRSTVPYDSSAGAVTSTGVDGTDTTISKVASDPDSYLLSRQIYREQNRSQVCSPPESTTSGSNSLRVLDKAVLDLCTGDFQFSYAWSSDIVTASCDGSGPSENTKARIAWSLVGPVSVSVRQLQGVNECPSHAHSLVPIRP